MPTASTHTQGIGTTAGRGGRIAGSSVPGLRCEILPRRNRVIRLGRHVDLLRFPDAISPRRRWPRTVLGRADHFNAFPAGLLPGPD